jgi:apolipoprotein N-acyltransferase
MGFPLALGGSQVHLPWASMLGVVGAVGTSGLLLGWGVATASAFVGVRRWPIADGRPFFATSTLWLAVAAATAGLGAWQPGLEASGSTRRVAIIQGGIPSWLYADAEFELAAEQVIEERYFQLVLQAMRQSPDVIILPEAPGRRVGIERGRVSSRCSRLCPPTRLSLGC